MNIPQRVIYVVSEQHQKSVFNRSWLRRTYVAVVVAICVVGGSYFTLVSHAASAPTITVSAITAGKIQTQLSTNNVWSGMVDGAPGAQAKLNALKAPYVRIHVGDDGSPVAMPDVKQGAWDFAALNTLVNNVFASGQQPLMNIKYAPDWQWTCATPQTGQAGTIKDMTFQAYADYMARLVNYYNKGSMTTENGTVITNPSGVSHRITYWEPWNEPDLNNETPCAPTTGNGLTPSEYVIMWNAVTTSMLQVDASLKFVGPATAGSQFGSSTTTGNQYVDMLMTNSSIKPAALSFHGYGYWDNTVTDKWIFDGDNTEPATNCCGGVADLKNGIAHLHAKYPTVPIWLTEVNVNADWGNDVYKRPSSEFAAAWWGTLFQQTAPLNAGIIHQYDVVDGPQFGLIDDQTGNAYISYYAFMMLNQAFPQGSTILSSSSSQDGVLSLAAKKPDGTISIMVVNRMLASSTVKSSCGTGGVASPVNVNFSGINVTAVSVQQLDKNSVSCSSNAASLPAVRTLDASQPITIQFPGYGLAIIHVASNGTTLVSPPPVPTPPPTPVPAPTPSPVPTPPPVTYGVTGIVYIDSNKNGIKDAGESGYALGAHLVLSSSTNQNVTSTSAGGFTFSGLANGTYSVNLSVPGGFTSTSPNPRTVIVKGGNITTNFGIFPVIVPTPTPVPVTTAGKLVIYDNAVSAFFKDNTYSYDSKSACDTSKFVSPGCSYSATFQSYGAFEFRYKNGTINPSAYKSLDFNINLNGQPVTDFGVILSTPADNAINEYFLLRSDVKQTLPNGWVHISIPMEALDAQGTNIGVVDIENAKDAGVSKIYLDDLALN